MKYPLNYNTSAAYINNLRPRNSPDFEVRFSLEMIFKLFHI